MSGGLWGTSLETERWEGGADRSHFKRTKMCTNQSTWDLHQVTFRINSVILVTISMIRVAAFKNWILTKTADGGNIGFV